jgi:hypothetical protein
LDDFWKRAGTMKFYDRKVWFLTSILNSYSWLPLATWYVLYILIGSQHARPCCFPNTWHLFISCPFGRVVYLCFILNQSFSFYCEFVSHLVRLTNSQCKLKDWLKVKRM